jgi:hypothetical protein|nr:MAG TPA: hypothetical protein [Caudoviricetes sp.]
MHIFSNETLAFIYMNLEGGRVIDLDGSITVTPVEDLHWTRVKSKREDSSLSTPESHKEVDK